MSKWNLFNPDYTKKNFISIFNDDIKSFSNCKNIWYICGTWKNNVRLINHDRKTHINCISKCKVIPFINTDLEYYPSDY